MIDIIAYRQKIGCFNLKFSFERKMKLYKDMSKYLPLKDNKISRQAGAELGQAQSELGSGENDLSLTGDILGWG